MIGPKTKKRGRQHQVLYPLIRWSEGKGLTWAMGGRNLFQQCKGQVERRNDKKTHPQKTYIQRGPTRSSTRNAGDVFSVRTRNQGVERNGVKNDRALKGGNKGKRYIDAGTKPPFTRGKDWGEA